MLWKLAWALGTDLASQPDALITRQPAICSTNRILATCQQNSKLNHIIGFRHGRINAKFHALRTSARNKGDPRYHLLFIPGKLVCPCNKKRVRRYGQKGEEENPELVGMQSNVWNAIFRILLSQSCTAYDSYKAELQVKLSRYLSTAISVNLCAF